MANPAAEPADRSRAMYDFDRTPVFALGRDPRFSYCLYVPPALARGGAPPDLVVAVHGTGRTFTAYRDAFSAFGRWHNCVVLAPLFPIGVLGDGYRDGFKYLREGDIRYDQILLAMIDEVGERYGFAFDRFALFGFSGGGHFANRFLLLHPGRLWAASIGAPGSVTLLDPTRDWWVGTRNVAALFGAPVDAAALARVPVQMVVGAADLETWEITHREGGRHWMPDANHAGRTRPERLERLKASFTAAGVAVRFDLVPNLAHDGQKAVPLVEDFFSHTLNLRRATA